MSERFNLRGVLSAGPSLFTLNLVIAGQVFGAMAASFHRRDPGVLFVFAGLAVTCIALAVTNRSVFRFAAYAAAVWGGFAIGFIQVHHREPGTIALVACVWWAVAVVLGSAIIWTGTWRRRRRARRFAIGRAALAQAILMAQSQRQTAQMPPLRHAGLV